MPIISGSSPHGREDSPVTGGGPDAMPGPKLLCDFPRIPSVTPPVFTAMWAPYGGPYATVGSTVNHFIKIFLEIRRIRFDEAAIKREPIVYNQAFQLQIEIISPAVSTISAPSKQDKLS